MNDKQTVYATLDREDLEKLIDAWVSEFYEKVYRTDERLSVASVRPIVYKLYDFLKRWEELNEKELSLAKLEMKVESPEKLMEAARKAISRKVTEAV